MSELLTIKPDTIINLDHLQSASLYHPGEEGRHLNVDEVTCLDTTGKLITPVLMIYVADGCFKVKGDQALNIFDWLTRQSAGF